MFKKTLMIVLPLVVADLNSGKSEFTKVNESTYQHDSGAVVIKDGADYVINYASNGNLWERKIDKNSETKLLQGKNPSNLEKAKNEHNLEIIADKFNEEVNNVPTLQKYIFKKNYIFKSKL